MLHKSKELSLYMIAANRRYIVRPCHRGFTAVPPRAAAVIIHDRCFSNSNRNSNILPPATSSVFPSPSFEIANVDKIHSCTITINKSKFTAIIGYAATIELALEFLEQHKDIKATHNCWAFKTAGYERYSDDGEVSGTAGKPILLAINSEKLVNCIIVVIRKYGGVQLGRGGLFKAYYKTSKLVAAEVLKVKEIR